MAGEPHDFSEEDPSGGEIAPDLPREPWDHDWEVTEPLLVKPEDNTHRNLKSPKTKEHPDAQMFRKVLTESGNVEAALTPFQQTWRGLKDYVIGEMDYGTWARKVVDRLAELGMDMPEKKDLIWWHEDGYTVDEAVQLAFQV